MRILFAVSNDNITTSVVNRYQQKYKEIITSKNVYYFNAIIKELQRNKSYDAIVIGEDLEPISNNNYEAIDKFLFEKLDGISDEASKPSGEDIPIIFICSDRRMKSDQLLIKLFGIGIYNAIIGNDRSIETVCNLINKPRNKKEAKQYYNVDAEDVGPYEKSDDQDVSESEIQNILAHYRKIGMNEKKCVESFESIADQYNETQLRVIINFLPKEVKKILESNSSRYQKLVSKGTVLTNGTYVPYNKQNPKVPGKIDVLTKDLEKTNLSKPVIIPSTININRNNSNNNVRGVVPHNNNIPVQNQVNRPMQNNVIMQNQVMNRQAQNNNSLQNEMNRQLPNNALVQNQMNRQEPNNITVQNEPKQVISQELNTANINDKNNQSNVENINQVQGVNNKEMQMIQNNENNDNSNQNINATPNIEQKRGRGRPRKIQPTQPMENTANTSNDIFRGENGFNNNVTSDLGNGFDSVSTIPTIKRKRGRPSKKETTSTQIEPYTVSSELSTQNVLQSNDLQQPAMFQPVEPKPVLTQGNTMYDESNSIQEPNLVEDSPLEAMAQKNENTEANKTFDDILPGLEEPLPGLEEPVDLFGISPIDDNVNENTNTDGFLPGFENDIENANKNVDSVTDDTNLFDLDLEDNTVNNNTSNVNQDNIYNQMYNANQDIYNQAPNANQDIYSQAPNTNQDIYSQVPNANQDIYNQVPNTNQDIYSQAPNANQDIYSQAPNANQDIYNQVPNTNQDIYSQAPNANQDIYNQAPNANQDIYNQVPNANQDIYNQTPNSNMQSQYNTDSLISNENVIPTNNNVIAGNGKIALFVGTTKNGTSFIVNNLAQLLSQSGVKTAILDLTKNKNSYYMFTDNDANLMKKAVNSIKNLSDGIVDGINVNKNLSVFTSLPDAIDEINKTTVLQTLSNNFEITLLDCDFNTDVEYFVNANEIYLIQSMDTFTIQPLTQFLSDLKLKNVLDESKLRVVINKYVRLRRLDERMIIGGMSKYNEPSMTLQRDLFNAQTIKYVNIPFEIETYERYLESIAMCSLSLNGYSQNFINSLQELKNMVYPLISGGNFGNNSQNRTEEKRGLFGSKKGKNIETQQTIQFSNNVNDTLNKMRTNNF